MEKFVKELATGYESFFNGWIKSEYFAMIPYNDIFRSVSFYLKKILIKLY